jgi:hypothetical protein
MTDARMLKCLEGGTSILVGAVDEHGQPACCRAIALTSNDDLASVTAYVPVATSRALIASVAMTGRMAVVVSEPVGHRATQLKGTIGTTRLARDEERDLVRQRLEQLSEMLNVIGVPRRLTRSVAHWPAFAIEMRVEEVYEQTPGPQAGTRLR